ncbi:MAG: hydrogenase small subunit [Planctomycetes bacterium]|nr:hydrogenase small subunit [Planctomycetota bacterium]
MPVKRTHAKALARLEARGLPRRDFLKICTAAAATFGLSRLIVVDRVAWAVGAAASKPPVLWLEGQDCAGCTVSFAGSLHPPTMQILLETISLRYHETLMAAAGRQAEAAYRAAVEQGGHVLVVEGSVPGADDRFCRIGGRLFREILEEAAAGAVVVIAVGACASYGGIPNATVTRGLGMDQALPGKTVVNLPTCPVHVEHLVGTLLHFLATGKPPALDSLGRPVAYFSTLIHDNCRRRGAFENGQFLTDWNDPKQKDWCLLHRGCKGPYTFADCPARKWDDGINFCIDCGAGCMGCAEPGFYDEMSPLFEG